MTDEPPDPPDSPDDPPEEPSEEPSEESPETPPNDGNDDSVSDSNQPSDQEPAAGDDEVDAGADGTEERFGESGESDEPSNQPNERAGRSDEHGDERRPSPSSSRRHQSESGFEARPGGQLLSRLFRLLESGAENGTGFGGAYGNAPFGDLSRRDDASRSRFDTDVDLTFSSIEPAGDDTRRNRRRGLHGERSPERARRDAVPSIDVAKRRYGTELEVVADVSAVGEDRVRVGFDDDDLVLADDDGHELSRVSLPWPKTDADATVNNGILTVRVTRVDSPDPADGEIDE